MLWGRASDPRPSHPPLPHTTLITETTTYIAEQQIINMAPIQFEQELRYGPVVAVAGHFLASLYLLVEVARSLHRSYRGLGPSQDTRERNSKRNQLLPLFAGLALLGFLRALYTTTEYATLSYKVWASRQGVEVPVQLYGNQGILPPGENATPLYLRQWLSDTPVHLDAIEILVEKARRFWWGQQIELSLVSWSLLLAIEGRRRNIPLLWCYQLLGQLVSLPLAQNLFFIALLLTPSPLPQQNGGSLPLSSYVRLRNRIFTPKPTNWTPPVALFLAIFALNLAAISLIPFFVNTPALKQLVLAGRALTFAPLMLQYIVPTSWGKTYIHHQDVYRSYTLLFRVLAVSSFVLHAKASIVGLAYNAPDAHHHRHRLHLPFDTEERSAWDRTTTGYGRLLGAISDHPIVGGVGWDVILSAVSLGSWAAVRATDVWDVLSSTVPLYKRHGRHEDADEDVLPPTPSVTTRGRSKALKAESDGTSAADHQTPRRRGRPRKVKAQAQADEAAYAPSQSEATEIEVGDDLGPGNLDWESAAVVWGLTALGGLGAGSAGVFGGECVAR